MSCNISDELDRYKTVVEEEKEHDNAKSEQQLLDHFAGLAMQGEITRCTSGYNFEETAKTAYMMAKAMLKARKETNP